MYHIAKPFLHLSLLVISIFTTMEIHHILNGDSLAEKLRQTEINRNFIVCRECLIEGELAADNLQDFYAIRAQFICQTYNINPNDYAEKCVREFDKIGSLPDDAEVCLWFEDDLFCQANMWFCISLLPYKPSIRVYRIFPIIRAGEDHWQGFARSNNDDLIEAYHNRVEMTAEDLQVSNHLWAAYKSKDFARLKATSKYQSPAFKYLAEVVQAHLDRFPINQMPGRPEQAIREILGGTSGDFNEVFRQFTKREGIYGFGDLQFKRIYDRVVSDLARDSFSTSRTSEDQR